MSIRDQSNLRFLLWIVLAFTAYLLSNGVRSIAVLAWIYPIFLLHIVTLKPSLKTCLLVGGILAAGFTVQFQHVIGMGLWLCIAVSILVSAVRVLPYLLWLQSKRNFLSTVTFAAAVTVAEYGIACIYPILGGLSDAYTQYQSTLLLQVVTITGVYGITFLMSWTAAVCVWLWGERRACGGVGKKIYWYITVMGLVLLYGVVKLRCPEGPSQSVRMAAVTVPVSQLLNEDEDVYAVFYTDSFTEKNLSAARRKLSEVTEQLFVKTRKEADAGAKLVFWSELNGAVMKEDEAELLYKASATAREQKIYLVVSLLVKTPYEDLKENKTVAFAPDGEKVSEYLKHGRSIGELCIKGDGKMQSFDTEYGRIAPFICSDMAFASQIRQAGRNKVDTLIIPASDWEEMTEIAVKTAVVRGVENGCNVVRHSNMGISSATDYKGNLLAKTNYFQSETKTMTAQILTGGRITIYSYIGNAFVVLCGVYLAASPLLGMSGSYNRNQSE